jgi:hypothetical protein
MLYLLCELATIAMLSVSNVAMHVRVELHACAGKLARNAKRAQARFA